MEAHMSKYVFLVYVAPPERPEQRTLFAVSGWPAEIPEADAGDRDGSLVAAARALIKARTPDIKPGDWLFEVEARETTDYSRANIARIRELWMPKPTGQSEA